MVNGEFVGFDSEEVKLLNKNFENKKKCQEKQVVNINNDLNSVRLKRDGIIVFEKLKHENNVYLENLRHQNTVKEIKLLKDAGITHFSK